MNLSLSRRIRVKSCAAIVGVILCHAAEIGERLADDVWQELVGCYCGRLVPDQRMLFEARRRDTSS